MSDGFLGYKASFMLDTVVCALIVVVPLLAYSLFVVKVQKNYARHRNLQILLGVLLSVAVGLFEIDIRVQGGVSQILAKRSVPLTPDQLQFFNGLLYYVHLPCAVSTVVLWILTLTLALRRIPAPPGPCAHSRLHKKLGWLSAVDITMTAVTGLMVYYFGFMI